MHALRIDLVLALRRMRGSPLFTSAIVVMLAVAVGSTTAAIGVAYGVLLSPLPIRDQDQVVVLEKAHPVSASVVVGFSARDLADYKRDSRSLESVAGTQFDGTGSSYVRDRERVFSVGLTLVSGEFFRVLGARPQIGRLLDDQDDEVGRGAVAVISNELWQRQFGGDTSVIGRALHLPGLNAALTIIGVTPRGFDFPVGTEMWIPSLTILPDAASGTFGLYSFVGRLRTGVTHDAAKAELAAFLSQRAGAPGEPTDLRARVRSIQSLIVGDVRPAIAGVTSLVGLLLLIAIANVASLFLVRTRERSRELAVRIAIGAGRPRLVVQLLTESLALACLGCIVAVLLAWLLMHAFIGLTSSNLPRADNIRLDAITFGGAAVITTLSALVFGLYPALLATRGRDLMSDLRAGTRSLTLPGGGRLANVTVSVQIALTLVVLVSAGLLSRTLLRLQAIDPGYVAPELIAAQLEIPSSLDTPTKHEALYDQLSTRIAALPDVSAATLVLTPPYAGARGWDTFYTIEGQTASEAAANPSADYQAVLPTYFATLGVPITRGRGIAITDRLGTPPVVVISEGLARRAWPGKDPVGKRLKFGGATAPSPWYEVVGVARDTRYRELGVTRSVVFIPWAQRPSQSLSMIVVRGREGRAPLPSHIRRVVDEVAGPAALMSLSSFDQMIARELSRPRFNALIVAALAAIATLIAAFGVYAVMSTFVRQRIPELGIRMAIGAQPSDVRRLVMRRGLAPVGAGMAGGLVMAIATTSLLQRLLYETSPIDPLTITAASLTTLLVSGFACYQPARLASRIDPSKTLRSE